MGADPFTPARETSVTMKQHKGFDASWLVFRGTVEEIKADIIAAFSYESADVTGLDLVALVTKATKDFQDNSLVAVQLGGTQKASTSKASAPGASSAEKPSDRGEPPFDPDPPKDNGWGNATEAAPPVDPKVQHLAAMEAITDVEALKLYWAKNQAAFTDAELMAAYKARGKALSAATK